MIISNPVNNVEIYKSHLRNKVIFFLPKFHIIKQKSAKNFVSDAWHVFRDLHYRNN